MMAFASTALAQASSRITGTVRDTTGFPLLRATVSVTTSSGQVVASTTTDDSGKYAIEDLKPDRYVIVVQATGFARQSRNLALETGSRTLDFVLSVDVL